MKTRVEKLCQAFENGKELVELSQCSPHDMSNVLKLYLRQVHKQTSTQQYVIYQSKSKTPLMLQIPEFTATVFFSVAFLFLHIFPKHIKQHFFPPRTSSSAARAHHAVPPVQQPDGIGQGESAS